MHRRLLPVWFGLIMLSRAEYSLDINTTAQSYRGTTAAYDSVLCVRSLLSAPGNQDSVSVSFAKEPNAIVSFDQNSTYLANSVIQNPQWQMSETQNAYRFTYIGNQGIFPAQSTQCLGVNIKRTLAQATKGAFVLQAVLDSVSNTQPQTHNLSTYRHVMDYFYTTDTVAPKIQLFDKSSLQVGQYTEFFDPGAYAFDSNDGELNVSVSGSVDTTQIGSSTLTYGTIDSSGNQASQTRRINIVPHTPSGAPVSMSYDPTFETTTGISLGYGSTFDAAVSRSGTRSIRMQSMGNSFSLYSADVQEDKWYLISGYMKIDTPPPRPITNIFIQAYRSNGTWVYNAADYTFSITKTGEWEEFLIPVYIQRGKGVSALKINFRYKGMPRSTLFTGAKIWIDDVKVLAVEDSSKVDGYEAPRPRVPFDGEKVRIDSLGNWEIKKGGKWEPFFPLIVYPDFQDSDWSKYKQKGFNTVSQIGYPGVAQKAINAGLYWMWDITSYLYFPSNNPPSNNVALLESSFQNFASQTDFNGMIGYYWDNEDLDEWDVVREITDKIKVLDRARSSLNKRSFPIYMNSKHMAANPMYMNDNYSFIDLQGCYINPLTTPFNGQYGPEWPMFVMASKMQHLRSPVGIGIINVPQEGDYLEPFIFAGIARGMRGFAFWRDTFNGQFAIESRAWWSNFDKTAQKIERMMPLIRTPLYTSWDYSSSIPEKEDTLVIGKRTLRGKKHLIIASFSDTTQTPTFTFQEPISKVWDYFSGEVLATPSGTSFSLSIGAHQTAVVVVE